LDHEGITYISFTHSPVAGHDQILQSATKTLEGPSLALIASLKPEEILEIRKEANGLFQLYEYIDRCQSIETMMELRDNFLEALINYWNDICNYLRNTRPLLTQKRTKLGVFTRDKIPHQIAFSKKYISFAINLAFDFFKIKIADKVNDKDANELMNTTYFRMLFFTDTHAMKQLDTLFPRRNWQSRYHDDYFVGELVDRKTNP